MTDPLSTTGPPGDPVQPRLDKHLPRAEHVAGMPDTPAHVLDSAVTAGGTTQQPAQEQSKERQQRAHQAARQTPVIGPFGQFVDQVA